MKIGLIGLGKMGYNLGLNLLDHQYEVIAYDVVPEALVKFHAAGGQITSTINEFITQLDAPRIIWIMVPAGHIVDTIIAELTPHLVPGDILMEGGNSHYKDSIRRSAMLREQGVSFFDIGTSGGLYGARNGACYMIGGDEYVFPQIEPLLRDTSVTNGYVYTGEAGSGHYAKMVHNGIEYGMMAAIGEGFEVLEKSSYDFDHAALAKVWSHGSVIRGWLMELAAQAFLEDPKLANIRGIVHSSGEGKWTIEEALDLRVATPIIALSLLMRYRSESEDTFTGKVLAALRNQFGGHAVEHIN